MAIPITIPRLGWNMDEGAFAGWLKKDGDTVNAGDSLFSLETDKAVEDIECLDAGTLRIPPDAPAVGAKVAVGAVIGYLLESGETLPAPAARETKAQPEATPIASPSVRRLARELGIDLQQLQGSGPGGRVTAEDVRGNVEKTAVASARRAPASERPATRRQAVSPRAKRVASESGVDWTTLHGTGKNNRIRERDVRAAVGNDSDRAVDSRNQHQALPISPIRRTIAERMVASAQSTAPVTLTTTVNASNLVNLRVQFKAGQQEQIAPSYTDFIIKLTAIALQNHPILNARWDRDQIALSRSIHIGVAVDTEAGLLVPVIRDVQDLPLREIAARSLDLIGKARQRKLSAEEMQGGTFTVTNLGAYGIDAFTPIINFPQCAILGIGRIQRRPVVVQDQIIPGEELTISLTFDHRIVDGAPAARFLQSLAKLVENPGPWLMG